MKVVLDVELFCYCIFYICFYIYYIDFFFLKIDELNGFLFFKMVNNVFLLFLGFFFIKMKIVLYKGFKCSLEI